MRAVALTLVVAGLSGSASAAHAYCRRSNCGGVAGTVCVPGRADDCGAPVHWRAGSVPYHITRSDDPLRVAAIAAIDRGFQRWRDADCGEGRRPGLATAGSIADADPSGRAAVGDIAFSDDVPQRGHGTLAITRLHFGQVSGRIQRAQTIFYTAQLAPHGAGRFLESIALHEAGHFLGLAHSADPSAVMSGEVEDGETVRTELSRDDVAAICAAFPPSDGAPRAGLAAVIRRWREWQQGQLKSK